MSEASHGVIERFVGLLGNQGYGSVASPVDASYI